MNEQHLTDDDLHAFRARRLAPADVTRVFDHTSRCDSCAAAWRVYLDIRAQEKALLAELTREEAASRRVRPRFAAIAAAAAVAVIGVLLLIREDRQPRAAHASAPRPPRVTRAVAQTPLPAVVADALARGYVRPPSQLAELLRTPRLEAERGSETARLADFQPNRVVVDTTRPIFRWTPVDGASYVVRVFRRDEEFMRSDRLFTNTWTPPRDLSRGATWSWQIDVTRGGATSAVPASPQSPATFIVLDEAQSREIARASSDHLLAGVLCARAGLRERAEENLRKAAEASADPRISRLAESIANWPR